MAFRNIGITALTAGDFVLIRIVLRIGAAVVAGRYVIPYFIKVFNKFRIGINLRRHFAGVVHVALIYPYLFTRHLHQNEGVIGTGTSCDGPHHGTGRNTLHIGFEFVRGCAAPMYFMYRRI